jgi:hypothetical protein
MKQQDRRVILGGVVIAVLAGLWSHFMGIGPEVDAFIDFLTVIAVLGSVAFIYLGRDLLGGDTARNLEVIGIGLSLYVLTYWASYHWDIVGNPAWLGFSAPGWSVFFGLMTLATFGMVVYGFYLFWEMGRS